MARKLKWIAGIGAALVFVVIVAAYVILASYDFNDLKPRIVKAVRDATGRELTIGGDIDLDVGLTPALVLTDIRFQNAPWGSQPELVRIGRFEIQVALLPLIGGDIEIKRLILVAPDVLIETDKSGKSNLSFQMPKKEVPKQEERGKLPALSFDNLLVKKGHFTFKDGQTGNVYKVMLNRLSADASGMDSPVNFALEGAFNKEFFNISGMTGPLSDLINPKKPWSLELTAKAMDVTLSLEGSISDPLSQRGMDLGFRLFTRDLTKLAQLAGESMQVNEPFEIAGRFGDTGPKTYKISGLKVTLGSNDINGSVEVNLSKKPLLVTAMLNAQRLDLRSLLPEPKETAGAEKKKDKPGKKPKRIFPDDPLPVDLLAQVDAILKVRAGQVLLPKFAAGNLVADITLSGGHLKVHPLTATIGGGTLKGLIRIKPHGKSAAVETQVKVKGLELGTMLKEVDVTDFAEGVLDVDINLKGRGGSVASLMAHLNGHVSVIMGHGRINNKHIDLMGADLSASVFRLLNPVKKKEDFTEINCMVSRFDIREGLAESTALVFDTSRMSVVGEGSIDLRTEKLDLSLKPLPKEGVGAGGLGRLSLSLGELAKPFKLAGTLAEPSLALDTTQAAIALGKAIGGTLLFGPVGIAAALVGGSAGDKNPCVAAVEAAKTGVKTPQEKPEKEKSTIDKTTESVEKGIKSIGSGLKKLFGR